MKRVSLASAMVIVISFAVAQTVPRAHLARPAQPMTTIAPFNAETEALAPHFPGHNAQVIYELIKAKLPNTHKIRVRVRGRVPREDRRIVAPYAYPRGKA